MHLDREEPKLLTLVWNSGRTRVEACLMPHSLLQQILNKKKNSQGSGDHCILTPGPLLLQHDSVPGVFRMCPSVWCVRNRVSWACDSSAADMIEAGPCSLWLCSVSWTVPQGQLSGHTQGTWRERRLGVLLRLLCFYTRYIFPWTIAS